MLAQRVGRIGFSATLEVADLAARLRAEGRDVLDFSAGQPDFPTPDAVKAAGQQAIADNRTRYTATAGVPELRRAISDRLRVSYDVDLPFEQVLVSPGAKASLYFACMALVDPGDEVVIPVPYWGSYPEQVRLAEGRPVFVDCREEDGFKLTASSLERALTPKSKVLILNYPSNPTGACYSRAELEPLAELCVRHGIWIIADEIYSRLLYDGRVFTSILQLGPAVAERAILIDGMSKTYSMTGWRIGYAAGPLEAISAMARIQSHSTSNPTSISQWASVSALAMHDEELAPRVEEFDRRRREMVRRLNSIRGVRCAMPEGAFYAFPNVSGCFGQTLKNGQDCARFLLEKAGVAVVPGEAFGSERYLRLSYAASFEQVSEGMERIAAALGALGEG